MTYLETSLCPQSRAPWCRRSVCNPTLKLAIQPSSPGNRCPPSISYGPLPTGEGGNDMDDVMWRPHHEPRARHEYICGSPVPEPVGFCNVQTPHLDPAGFRRQVIRTCG